MATLAFATGASLNRTSSLGLYLLPEFVDDGSTCDPSQVQQVALFEVTTNRHYISTVVFRHKGAAGKRDARAL